jgi:hypothetical protein
MQLLNSEQKVQECDATDDDSSTTAGLKKNYKAYNPFIIFTPLSSFG